MEEGVPPEAATAPAAEEPAAAVPAEAKEKNAGKQGKQGTGGKQGKGGGGGGASEPAAEPPPRVAARFEAALAEGALQEREAAGMMRGVLAQLGSGKQTEDAIIAQTTKKIEGMKQKAEKKRMASAKKAANKLKQAELARKRKAAIHRPEELLEQLASPDEGTQLLAAKNVAGASLKLQGKQQREFQDAMVPGLDALVTLAEGEQDEHRTAAFDALHRLLMYHKASCTAVAETTIIPTITKILQNRERASSNRHTHQHDPLPLREPIKPPSAAPLTLFSHTELARAASPQSRWSFAPTLPMCSTRSRPIPSTRTYEW
jgi:hypothetical protein